MSTLGEREVSSTEVKGANDYLDKYRIDELFNVREDINCSRKC